MTEDYRLVALLKKVKDIKQYGFRERQVDAVYSEIVSVEFPVNGKNTGNFVLFQGKNNASALEMLTIARLHKFFTQYLRKLTGNSY